MPKNIVQMKRAYTLINLEFSVTVREKSGKCQGILFSSDCGNPDSVCLTIAMIGHFQFESVSVRLPIANKIPEFYVNCTKSNTKFRTQLFVTWIVQANFFVGHMI